MASLARSSRRRRWRRARSTLVTLVVLALVFFGGGGWYFSSQIESDALAVDANDTPDLDVEVAAVGEKTITFVLGDDPSDDLTSDELLGVFWQDGYGQVGEVVDLTTTDVTRTYTHLIGEPGGVSDLVGLEGYAFPSDPEAALGLATDTVGFGSALGSFDAWFWPGDDDTWVIFVHGRGAHPREALRALPTVTEAGHPGISIFYRNDLGQPATDDGLARFGVTEWEDLEGAVRFARGNGAEDVIVYGYSMGGAIAISFMVNSTEAGAVSALVLDAPALKLGAMVDARAADTDLPLVPMKVPPPLTSVAKWMAGVRFDVDWEELNWLDRADELAAPVLLFHGTEDDSVPVWLSDALAEARPDIVTYERFEGAGHVRAWNVDPERYEAAVAAFLELHG